MNYFDFQCVIVRLGLGFDFMELNLCDPRGGYCGLALKVCPFLLLRKKMSMLMMGHGVGPCIGPNEIKSPSPMMNFITINYLFNFIFGFIQ